MVFTNRAASMLVDFTQLWLPEHFRAIPLIFWEDSLDDSDYKDRSHLLISASRLSSDAFIYTLFLIIFLTEELKEMKYKIES